jgi:hypothetical protein
MLFKLIPSNRASIPSAVARLHEEYQTDISKTFKDPNNPLDGYEPSRDASVIRADIARSIKWFHVISDASKLSPIPEDDIVIVHAYRVLASLSKLKGYSYTQGFDRYVFVTYVLGLHFTMAGKLPAEVAESLSFALTREILRLIKTDELLECSPAVASCNSRIDKLVTDQVPEVGRELADAGLTSYHYALRWQLLLFADEHPWDGIVAIWDAVFARKKYWDDMIAELALAHVKHVPPNPDVFALERIQKCKKWDAMLILKDAITEYNKVHGAPRPVLTVAGRAMLVLAIIIVVVYVIYRE